MDVMYVDPDRGRSAVSAAVAAVTARRTGPAQRAPDIPVAAFGRGLADRGEALVGALGTARGERDRILARLDSRLEDLDRALRQVTAVDRSASEQLGGVSAPAPAGPAGVAGQTGGGAR